MKPIDQEQARAILRFGILSFLSGAFFGALVTTVFARCLP